MKIGLSQARLCQAVWVAGFGMLIAAVPLLAHHSFAAEYDAKKPVKISGIVTKIEWMNPHARFYVDVKGAAARSRTGILSWAPFPCC